MEFDKRDELLLKQMKATLTPLTGEAEEEVVVEPVGPWLARGEALMELAQENAVLKDRMKELVRERDFYRNAYSVTVCIVGVLAFLAVRGWWR